MINLRRRALLTLSFVATIATSSLSFGQDRDIFKAIKSGDTRVVQEILMDKKFDVNQADDQGHTPLYFSCLYRNPEMVKLLLENGANINKESQESIDRSFEEEYATDIFEASKIDNLFKLTQKFDRSIKSCEKFELLSDEKEDRELVAFEDTLNNKRKEIIEKLMYTTIFSTKDAPKGQEAFAKTKKFSDVRIKVKE